MVRSHKVPLPPLHLVEKIDQRLKDATAESLALIYPRLWAQFGRTAQSDTHIARVVFAAVWAVEAHPAFPKQQLTQLRKAG